MEDEAREWQNRLLDPIYPIVWLDAIVVKIHAERKVVNKAVQIALGLNMEGKKELLGAWVTENEGGVILGTGNDGNKKQRRRENTHSLYRRIERFS